MKSQNHINLKPPIKESSFISKLSILKTFESFTVFAVMHTGNFLPLRTGSLQQVIEQTEHCSAYFGLPVEHELNRPIKVIVNKYVLSGDQWAWAGREVKTYPDGNAAYLDLRSVLGEIQGLEIVEESDNVKRTFTCSQERTKHWEAILHRLQRNGQIIESGQKGECPQCFSHFLTLREGGETCLNCGYEQIRD